jgi:hypothetical protein
LAAWARATRASEKELFFQRVNLRTCALSLTRKLERELLAELAALVACGRKWPTLAKGRAQLQVHFTAN